MRKLTKLTDAAAPDGIGVFGRYKNDARI